MRKYDTILWDLDGTLLDFERCSRYALALCLKERGITMTEEVFYLPLDEELQQGRELSLHNAYAVTIL